MIFDQNLGLTKVCISSDSRFPQSSGGFIMIPCMSDLVE